jgi:hypothetical protein
LDSILLFLSELVDADQRSAGLQYLSGFAVGHGRDPACAGHHNGLGAEVGDCGSNRQ